MSSAHEPAAAAAFAELIVKEADNNVKLIVLDRFDNLRAKHEHVLDGMVMDILKVLSRCVTPGGESCFLADPNSSQDMEVKRKAIGIALEMVSSRNVEDVVLFLKKQLTSTMEQEYDKVRHEQLFWSPYADSHRTSNTANCSSRASIHAPSSSRKSLRTSCTS